MKALPLSQTINKGIEYLFSAQQKDGSFLSFSSTNEQDFTKSFSQRTTFLNAFILLQLSVLDANKKNVLIKKHLANFLLAQKSKQWSWNYWVRNSKNVKIMPYPDDLDDTFCALTALVCYDKKIISGEVFANFVKLLTATEKKEGGPYTTWLVRKDSALHWRDVDFAVNSNIGYFLSLVDIQLPKLQKFFETMLKKKQVISPYYPSFHAPLFFLSRFYTGAQSQTIADNFLQAKGKKGIWENPLKTALAILTLLKSDYPIKKMEKSILYLKQTQQNGKWEAYGFCIDPSVKGERYFAGSPGLTTAFCLAALHQYQRAQETKKRIKINEETEKEKDYLKKIITEKVEEIFSKQKDLVGERGQLLIQKIYTRDSSGQIPLMPYYFLQSLGQTKLVTKKNIVTLGIANVLGWIAYTIYDGFLDDEGDPTLLSLANFCLRNLTDIFVTFSVKRKSIQENFHTIMNRIDQANAWETRNCRIIKNASNENIFTPDYKNLKQLAHKSIGHALGPLTILLLLGFKQKSDEYKSLYLFYSHFLIAKQLHDDAHDFEIDLKKNRITPVVSLLLQKAKEKNMKKNKENYKELFWREVIGEVCQLIYFHTAQAKASLKKSRSISQPIVLQSLLLPFEKGADQALQEQKRILEFLRSMKFEEYLQKHKNQIHQEITDVFLTWKKDIKKKAPQLDSLANVLLVSNQGGKSLRGILIRLGYDLCSRKNSGDIYKISAAYEILHTSILIHDDIIDKSVLRRGKKTVVQTLGGNHYGISQAICLGDIGFFLATQLISKTGFSDKIKSKVIAQFSQIVLDPIAGEMLDVKLANRKEKIEEASITNIALLKTAYYTITGPLTLGAMLGGATSKQLAVIKLFGKNLGIAFQIKDDILGIFGDEKIVGKSVTSDIEEGKNSVLFLHALANASQKQNAVLSQYYGQGKITKKQHGLLKEVLQDTGALDYAEKTAKEYIGKAQKTVAAITPNEKYRNLLSDFILLLTERKK